MLPSDDRLILRYRCCNGIAGQSPYGVVKIDREDAHGRTDDILPVRGRSRVPRKRYAVRLYMHPDHRTTALLRLSGARIFASPPGCTKVSGEGSILLIMRFSPSKKHRQAVPVKMNICNSLTVFFVIPQSFKITLIVGKSFAGIFIFGGNTLLAFYPVLIWTNKDSVINSAIEFAREIVCKTNL